MQTLLYGKTKKNSLVVFSDLLTLRINFAKIVSTKARLHSKSFIFESREKCLFNINKKYAYLSEIDYCAS